MNNPLETMLQQVGLKSTAFAPTSRYYGIETATIGRHPNPDGPDDETAGTPANEPVAYLRRRFVPAAERFSLLQEHVVTDNERLDTIANHYLGDPERFWQLCDANNAIRPDELTETVGRRIRITLPEGIPGSNHA